MQVLPETTLSTQSTKNADFSSRDFIDYPISYPWGNLCPKIPNLLSVGEINH